MLLRSMGKREKRKYMQRKMLSCDVVSVEAPTDPMGSADTRMSFRVVPGGARWKANMSWDMGLPEKGMNMGTGSVCS